jgi:hypothetical protein
METQNDMIKNHLLNGNSITALDSFRLFSCMRLAARISDLKQSGMVIDSETVTQNGKSFSKYFIKDLQKKE